METVNWDTRQQKSQWAAHGRMFLNQTGPSRCKPSQAFRLCNLILFKTEWINPMAWPQKKLLRHSARQKYQNCFHMQEKKKKLIQDWTYGRDLWQVQTEGPEAAASAESYSLHRASGRTAVPSTARDWLLISIFTASFNILKKSQANSRHFHTVFPGIPQISYNLLDTSSGGGFWVFSMLPLLSHIPD